MLQKVIFLFLLTVSIGAIEGSHRVKRIVGGMTAEAPPKDDPVVFVHRPTTTIRIEGLQQDDTGFYSFLGIPYADPPTGKNRFVRARIRRLVGDIMATKYPSPCPQLNAENSEEVVGSEDCLKLNIHTPQMPDPDVKLPVIVFLHGGGFRYGSPSQYDPKHLVGQKVIFVGVQYRLGSLGILGLGSKEFPSNGALSDCVAALRWTNRYIQYFGGDPERVTILGHGSGASLAIMMSLVKHTSSLIRGIVAMSGSALAPHAVDKKPPQSLEEVKRVNRCFKENPLMIFRCLQNVPANEIVLKDTDIQMLPKNSDVIADLSGFLGFSPSIEDKDDNRGLPGILTDPPRSFLLSGKFHSKIRLLIGQTQDETSRCSSVSKIPKNTLKKLEESAGDFLSLFNLTNPLGFFNQLGTTLLNVGGVTKKFLDDIFEATTDIFFSIPVVFTAKFWSDAASSVIYSFNFLTKSKLPGGEIFLPHLSLTQGPKQEGKVAHGDELIFLFEPRDIFGNPLGNVSMSFSAADEKVRKDFTAMIAKFTEMEEEDNSTSGLFSIFSSAQLPYMEVSDKITPRNNFRICSLIKFGGIFSFADDFQCEVIKGVDTVKETMMNVGDTIAKATYLDKVVHTVHSPIKSVKNAFGRLFRRP
uniref:Putative conserved secreted protein n=1 Tax=Lutzomyia longipalpis TaxID=7200 RepID=A0A1B0CSD4_LUTLO